MLSDPSNDPLFYGFIHVLITLFLHCFSYPLFDTHRGALYTMHTSDICTTSMLHLNRPASPHLRIFKYAGNKSPTTKPKKVALYWREPRTPNLQMTINCLSLNARGLNHPAKRHSLWKEVSKHKADMLCV